MAKTLKNLLLLALPASGKSEVRRYLSNLEPTRCAQDFHLGETVQLDDFPYVHMMREIDIALESLGEVPVFFEAPNKPFRDPHDWGTLIELVNEDYEDLIRKRPIKVDSAGEWLLTRINAARAKVGAPTFLDTWEPKLFVGVVAKIETEARKLLQDKLENYPATIESKTLVIEFARGGADGSSMPLAEPFGYAYSLSRLHPDILADAAVLYIWVTPEESRRKNAERTNPEDPGSILHHGVPLDVLMNDYGCDDIEFLMESSKEPGTITVRTPNKSYLLPIARFDNRKDKTSFVRDEPKAWDEQDVQALHEGLQSALETLAKRQ